jgi:hypothetical protein
MLAWPAAAQTQPDAASQEATRRLLERVQDLERQVRELREAEQPKPVAQSALPDDPPQNDHDGSHTPDLSNPETRVSPLAEIHWFGDVGFRLSDQQGENASFALGQLDLFLTSNLTDHLNTERAGVQGRKR